jgi:NAD(P)H-dependent FMN reductase
MQIFATSGSLRAASTNTTLRKAAAALVPEDVTLRVSDGLGDLPHSGKNLQESDIVTMSDPSPYVRSALAAFARVTVQI